MTGDQRLDQLEPLLSEAMTILDRHTAQLKQLTNMNSQIIGILTQQSDNSSLLLQEHIVIKTDVATLKTDVAELKTDVATLKTDVAELKTDVAEVKTDVAALKTDMAEMRIEFGTKLDLILA